MQVSNRKPCMKYAFCGISSALVMACGGGSSGDQEPDPVAVDLPIAYVKRPLPSDDQGARSADNVLTPAVFNPGAELILRDRASAGAGAVTVTAGVFEAGELYDVKDLEASSDGDKILFAMRAPEIEGLDEDEQPKWNIWEYELSSDTLRRIIESDIVAEAGQDLAPHYLPDGRIVFSSTRQRRSRAILLDEGKPQYSGLDESRNTEAFVLHVMDDDGGNIEQITYNQSHDLDPTVLQSGEVLFTRWDNIANRNSLSLYKVDPNGRNLSIHYGYHCQDTGTDASTAVFLQPREMPDGKILASLRATSSLNLGGDIVAIDSANYTEIDQPVVFNSGATGPGQEPLSTDTVVTTDIAPSPHGHFSSAYPLYDGTNRLLVSWSQCRLTDPDTEEIIPCTEENLAIENVQQAAPFYGIWIYNLDDGTQRPVITATEGTLFTDAITLEPRTAPTYIAPKEAVPRTALNDGNNDENEVDEDLVAEGVGVIHIRSVYDFDGTDTSPNGIADTADPALTSADERPARFLRIVKAVPIPDRDVRNFDNSAFGVNASQSMRDIIGYAPIEPDGSVKIKVPADIPFAISVLDGQGKRLPGYARHQNWLQLRPGEVRECNGCHTADSEIPHGRPGAGPASINSGAVAVGEAFPNTNPRYFAGDPGETMAEIYARVEGIRTPSLDIEFVDEWVDPDNAATPAADSFALAYNDLDTPKPTSDQCITTWTPLCRTTLHYPTHIQPLWEKDRGDNTCINCHSDQDAMGNLREPAGHLDLSGATSNANTAYLVSYLELLRTDVEREEVGGQLQPRLELVTDADGNPVYETNPDDSLVTDADGNPVQATTTIPVTPAMSAAGAAASSNFFSPVFETVDHNGFLEPAEVKLISEWLDIGAQYYNNPFDAPEN